MLADHQSIVGEGVSLPASLLWVMTPLPGPWGPLCTQPISQEVILDQSIGICQRWGCRPPAAESVDWAGVVSGSAPY